LGEFAGPKLLLAVGLVQEGVLGGLERFLFFMSSSLAEAREGSQRASITATEERCAFYGFFIF
jgi:hypothetical protein